jgi:hypothetical protein
MMTDDFVKLLDAVSEITEISTKEIMSSSRKMEYVEARMLVCKAMTELGYHPSQIAKKLFITPNNIRLLTESFHCRVKTDKLLIRMYQEIIKKLTQN